MRNRALVVGINAYETLPLKWAVRDAEAVGKLLALPHAGYDVETLIDKHATRAAVLEGIRRLSASRQGVRLLFMAGHAALAPQGARFRPFGALDWTGAVSFAEISALVKTGLSATSPMVVILDCCHAGALEIEVAFTTQQLQQAVSKDVEHANLACLLACTVGASARETTKHKHGVFTYHLLNGLGGHAADASDGAVTAESLYLHVAKQLAKTAYPKPTFKASLSGRLILLNRPPEETRRRRAATISRDISKLSDLVAETDKTIASIKPPNLSRDQYRQAGWQQGAKIIQVLAEKRNNTLQRWGTSLDEIAEWRTASEDVNSLLRDIANVSPGMVTEFGPITERLGEGGFGSVFKVASKDAVLAYKVFHPNELENPAKLERFRIGYRAMNMLDHPKIVKVSKFIESPLSFYMSFVDGQNIRKWYGSSQDHAELIGILIAIIQTVEYAHGVQVIHRDIKPENVILRWDADRMRWDPCLTDFDLAWFPAATSHTVEAFGAPFYAAPEQLTDPGKPIAHQAAVDVYALAMLGTFLLTGRDPVNREEAFQGVERSVHQWHSQQASELLVQTLKSAGDRDASKRLSIQEMRKSLMVVAEYLAAVANPNATLEKRDFLAHIGSLLGYVDQNTQGGSSATYWSASDRTAVDVMIVDGGFDITFRKVDQFMAEGATTSQARVALVRRVDARLEAVRRDAPAGVGLQRRGGSGGAHIKLECRNATLSTSVAAFVSRAIADVVSVCEMF